MKYLTILTLATFLTVISPLNSQEEQQESEHESRRAAWEKDSETILSILADIRQYRENSNDTDLQAKHKKKKFDEELSRLNRQYLNQTLKLNFVKVKNVTTEKVLSQYGFQSAKKIISNMKKNPQTAIYVGNGNPAENSLLAWYLGIQLASCKKCFEETGNYEIEFSIPVSDENMEGGYRTGIRVKRTGNNEEGFNESYQDEYIEVKILLIEKSEKKAMSYSKGQIIPLTGKIKSIIYKGGMFESVTITFQ
jgi:hypothetical protein